MSRLPTGSSSPALTTWLVDRPPRTAIRGAGAPRSRRLSAAACPAAGLRREARPQLEVVVVAPVRALEGALGRYVERLQRRTQAHPPGVACRRSRRSGAVRSGRFRTPPWAGRRARRSGGTGSVMGGKGSPRAPPRRGGRGRSTEHDAHTRARTVAIAWGTAGSTVTLEHQAVRRAATSRIAAAGGRAAAARCPGRGPRRHVQGEPIPPPACACRRRQHVRGRDHQGGACGVALRSSDRLHGRPLRQDQERREVPRRDQQGGLPLVKTSHSIRPAAPKVCTSTSRLCEQAWRARASPRPGPGRRWPGRGRPPPPVARGRA